MREIRRSGTFVAECVETDLSLHGADCTLRRVYEGY